MPTITLTKAKWPPKVGEYSVTDKSIFIRCGACKQLATLEDHTVGEDGTVSPSVVCPYDKEKCDWHVMLVLEGWNE